MDRRNRIEQLCQGNTGRSCGTRNMTGSGYDPFSELIAKGTKNSTDFFSNLLGSGNTSGKKIYMDPDGTEDISKEENKEIEEDSKEDTDYTDLIKKQREEKEDELHDEMLNTILEDESNITAFVTSYYEAGHITKGDADILLVKLTNKANKNKKKYESIITRLKGKGLMDLFRRRRGRTGSEPLIDENEEVLTIASSLFSHYLKNRNNRRLDEWLNGSRKRPKTTKSKKFKKKVLTEYFKMKNNHVEVEYEREDGSKVDMKGSA